MLDGRYPSEEFAELRARIVWDRVAGTVRGRAGAQRLAVTSGGTIPDRGLYSVNIFEDGRRVGELDEEMVYELRAGEVVHPRRHQLALRRDHPAAGAGPARAGRTREGRLLARRLRRAARTRSAPRVGAMVRELRDAGEHAARERACAARAGLDERAARNLIDHLADQARGDRGGAG